MRGADDKVAIGHYRSYRSLWGLGRPLITTHRSYRPHRSLWSGYIFVTRAAKVGRIRKLKSLGNLRSLTKQGIPIATFPKNPQKNSPNCLEL